MTSAKFEEALQYAAHLHRDQIRKGTRIPYVTHLMSVGALVGEYGGDEEQMIAGLLHDAVEDQGGKETLAEIRRRFGERVAAIVDSCSDTDQVPKPPWRERKEAYLRHLTRATPDARLVSAADKLHNMRTLIQELRRGAMNWGKFKGGRDGTLWYYRELVKEFKARVPADVAAELDRTFAELERLA